MSDARKMIDMLNGNHSAVIIANPDDMPAVVAWFNEHAGEINRDVEVKEIKHLDRGVFYALNYDCIKETIVGFQFLPHEPVEIKYTPGFACTPRFS